jgi:hypothetical protein
MSSVQYIVHSKNGLSMSGTGKGKPHEMGGGGGGSNLLEGLGDLDLEHDMRSKLRPLLRIMRDCSVNSEYIFSSVCDLYCSKIIVVQYVQFTLLMLML